MAQNLNPVFALIPVFAQGVITGVQTVKTGGSLTNVITLYTAATNGSKITEIGYKFQGNSNAGLLLIFITDTSGNNPELFAEMPIAAITSSTTVAAATGYITFADFQLASGQKIMTAITAMSGSVACNVYAKIGEF